MLLNIVGGLVFVLVVTAIFLAVKGSGKHTIFWILAGLVLLAGSIYLLLNS